MKKKKTITLATKPTYQGYNYGFKIAIVEKVENGTISINQAAKEFDNSLIYPATWLRKSLLPESISEE